MGQYFSVLSEYKEYYGNGVMSLHGFHRFGKLEGECKQWHPNGDLWRHEFFKNGEFDGEQKEWAVGGRLHEQEFYKNGKLEGERKQWHMNGHLWIRQLFRENCIVEYERWYDHDQLAEMDVIRNSIREIKCWSATGNLWKHQISSDKTCEIKEWHENGQIRKHTIIDDRKSTRICQCWYENGWPNTYNFYRFGLFEGEQRYWFSTGSMIRREFFQAGICTDYEFTLSKKMILLSLKHRLLFRFIRNHQKMLNVFLVDDLISVFQP